MRRIFVAAALTLAALSSPALADETIVRWDRVDCVVGADYMPVLVGPFAATGRWRTTGSGQVISPINPGNLLATVVCNSTERYGPVTWADATVFASSGSLRWQGFLNLPTACVDNPEELVFLVRHLEGPPFFGGFVLYGTERSIR